MDWKFQVSAEWDWQNYASYSGRAIEIPKHNQLFSHQIQGNEAVDNGSLYSSGGSGFSGSDMGHCSSSKSSISASMDSLSRVGTTAIRTVDSLPQYFGEKEELTRLVDKKGNFGSGEPLIGLKLGRRTYFEDICTASTTKGTFSVISTPSPTAKRSRASYQNSHTPRCQVEGCNLDLTSAKDYHRRHRICERHSKSDKVIVAGVERRFCQQCSRFHELSEFDDKKRSCRRRLSEHNARRRRPQPEAIQFSSAQMPSSLYDQRPWTNFLLNRVPFQVPNPAWNSACSFKITGAGDSLIGPAKAGCINRKPRLPDDDIPNTVSTSPLDSDRVSAFQGTAPRVLNYGFEASPVTPNLDVAPDLQRALSLLSTNSWGLNEPTSLEQLVQGNHASVPQQPVLLSEQQNWAPSSSEYERMVQTTFEARMHSLDVDSVSSSQFQEFQLFKAPQDSDCFYSNQIN